MEGKFPEVGYETREFIMGIPYGLNIAYLLVYDYVIIENGYQYQ